MTAAKLGELVELCFESGKFPAILCLGCPPILGVSFGSMQRSISARTLLEVGEVAPKFLVDGVQACSAHARRRSRAEPRISIAVFSIEDAPVPGTGAWRRPPVRAHDEPECAVVAGGLSPGLLAEESPRAASSACLERAISRPSCASVALGGARRSCGSHRCGPSLLEGHLHGRGQLAAVRRDPRDANLVLRFVVVGGRRREQAADRLSKWTCRSACRRQGH